MNRNFRVIIPLNKNDERLLQDDTKQSIKNFFWNQLNYIKTQFMNLFNYIKDFFNLTDGEIITASLIIAIIIYFLK